MVKVFKAFGHRHGRRGKDSRVNLGQPLGCQGLANIDALRGHRLAAGTQPAIDLQRIHVVFIGAVNDELEVLALSKALLFTSGFAVLLIIWKLAINACLAFGDKRHRLSAKNSSL